MSVKPQDHTALELAMFDYDKGDPKRIQHFVKVRALARTIGLAEGLDETTLHTLEAAAIVHDSGIHESERIYHDTSGNHQEELGPGVARPLLEAAGYEPDEIDRVCWLIAHHHDMDLQVLVEADFLVNIYEDAMERPEARRRMAESAAAKVFKTRTGLAMLRDQFLS